MASNALNFYEIISFILIGTAPTNRFQKGFPARSLGPARKMREQKGLHVVEIVISDGFTVIVLKTG